MLVTHLTPLLTNVQANEWYTLTLHRGGTALSGPLSIKVTQESDPGKTATVTQTVSDLDWQFRHTIQAGMVYLDDYKEISEEDSNVYVYGSKPHAVTSITSGGQTIRQYTYDLNGNMTQRIEGSDTYTFTYDAENRLATGAKNGVTLASYTYDGDGKRVKAQEGGFTTYYIGDYYEWREGPTTTAVKYYYAAGQRIAMRQGGVLTWLLGDHLGSTTITANENGTLASEQTYTAWGQTRSGSVTTDRQYTGQISEPQLGIYFYNARYYDPYLSRWLQADSIVPNIYNAQSWDRYAYVLNNSVIFTDPSGHDVGCDTNYHGSCKKMAAGFVYKVWHASPEARLSLKFVGDWDSDNRQAFIVGAWYDAKAQFNAYCKPGLLLSGECGYSSSEELYHATHGTTVLTMSTATAGYYCERNANAGQAGTTCYANSSGKIDRILAAHELGHVFNARIANNGQATPYSDLTTERANNLYFPAIGFDITLGYNRDRAIADGEDFANMYSMYVFNAFPPTLGGQERKNFMVTNIASWVGSALP